MTGCRPGRLHVDHEFCIVEVVATETTDEWERGELLVTALGADAVPFLRYRIGDVGTRARRPCPCGRPGESFLWIDGRIEDYVVTPEGRRRAHGPRLQGPARVAEAQFVQDTADALTVRLVPRPGFDGAAERRFLAEIRAHALGPALALHLERVPRIEREPNGKLRAVKSRVGRIAG